MATTKSKLSKAATLARVQAFITGAQKRFPNGTFTLGNAAYTTATLVQLFQSLVAAITGANAAQASAKDGVTAMRATEAKVSPVLGDFEHFVRTSFGTATEALADFGLEPPKARAPRTIAQKAAAAAKLVATRAARGTTSKKQKLAITGNVTGVTITPIVEPSPAPPTPAAPPAPVIANAPPPGTASH